MSQSNLEPAKKLINFIWKNKNTQPEWQEGKGLIKYTTSKWIKKKQKKQHSERIELKKNESSKTAAITVRDLVSCGTIPRKIVDYQVKKSLFGEK